MPTLIGHGALAESVELCRALRLSFVEINMNLPWYQVERLDARELLRHEGVYFTLHLDENLDPFCFNPAVARAYWETAVASVKFARAARMPVVNIHFPEGVYFSLPDKRVYLYDRYWNEVRPKITDFRDAMADAAGGDVLICVENTKFGALPRLVDALELLLRSPAFALTYDCGHDHRDGSRAAPFYAEHADRVRHIHLHDADGRTAHLPLGAGEIDIHRILSMAAGCRAVLETKDIPGLRASANWLSERNLLP